MPFNPPNRFQFQALQEPPLSPWMSGSPRGQARPAQELRRARLMLETDLRARMSPCLRQCRPTAVLRSSLIAPEPRRKLLPAADPSGTIRAAAPESCTPRVSAGRKDELCPAFQHHGSCPRRAVSAVRGGGDRPVMDTEHPGRTRGVHDAGRPVAESGRSMAGRRERDPRVVFSPREPWREPVGGVSSCQLAHQANTRPAQ